MRTIWLLAAMLLGSTVPLHAQSQDYDAGGFSTGLYGAGWKGAGSVGVYIGIFDTSRFPKLWPGGVFLELGATGPIASRPMDGTFSINYQSTFFPKSNRHREAQKFILPFVTAGYTRYFVTGNAVDYGAGVNWRIKGGSEHSTGMRIEYREAYIAGIGRRPEFRLSYDIFEAVD